MALSIMAAASHEMVGDMTTAHHSDLWRIFGTEYKRKLKYSDSAAREVNLRFRWSMFRGLRSACDQQTSMIDSGAGIKETG